MDTLLLDQTTWDLAVDTSGNVAMASDPYAVAQDAASSMKTFRGEVFYDTSRGVPYFADILGQSPPLSLVKTYLNEAASISVAAHQITDAQVQVFLTGFSGRVLSGQVQIELSSGQTTAVGF